MTNKEFLLQMINAATNESLVGFLCNGTNSLEIPIGNAICVQCELKHDGKCPVEEGYGDCTHTFEEWMDWEAEEGTYRASDLIK